MKKLLPILAFLFASFCSHAQNWSPLTPGVKRYFINSNNYLRGMRIDSVINYGSDLHYYPFRTARWPSDLPLGSWLGMEVIKKADGRFLFPNYWDDTITLKPLAAVTDSWLFYQDDGTKYYNATVTGFDTMTILGSLDSIKRIVITAYENGQPLQSDSFNNVELILSKSNGFYAILDLYHFPYHQPDTNLAPFDYFFRHVFDPVQLPMVCSNFSPDTLGPSRFLFRQVEFINPTSASMHDWNVGDVQQYSWCWVSSGTVDGCTIPWYYSLDTIIAKNVSASGVEYITHGWRAMLDSVYGFNNALYSITPFSDTVFYSSTAYRFSQSFMPEEYGIYNYSNPPFYSFFPGDTSFCSIGDKYYTCWDHCGISWVQAYRIEKSGVGLIHENGFDGSDGFTVNDSTLVYFVRNGIPCGTFIYPDTSLPVVYSESNITIEESVRAYPNPTYEQLNIETFLSNYNLSLINTIGQIVYAHPACSGKQTIDVSHFVSGIYYLRIETEDHQTINRKVIIQN